MENVSDKESIKDEAGEVSQPSTDEEINIYYRRSPDHRTIQADGAWAGLTPQLDIQIALFKELQPMPEQTRHKVSDGMLGTSIENRGNVGIDREVQTTVVLTPVTAIQIMKLMGRMLHTVMSKMPPDLRQQLQDQINDTK